MELTGISSMLEGCQQSCRVRVSRDLLIPFPIFELIENPRQVEVLLEMINRLFALGIGSCPRLMSIDVVPSHWRYVSTCLADCPLTYLQRVAC